MPDRPLRDRVVRLLPVLDQDSAVWISRFHDRELLKRAGDIECLNHNEFPLRGLTFGVKDNIDVHGLPTTAACPAFAHNPCESAPVVNTLVEAGALCIGKTNMDQFAAGLVGVRSPYGIPGNPFGADYVPGGSSSGSAVAVALGQVDFALGTDTAGSGRIPAAFNDLYGWKPTRGLLSTRGVVPACRSLDCVSVFAKSPALLGRVAPVLIRHDDEDAFSRPIRLLPSRAVGRVGVPSARDLEFFGDHEYGRLWGEYVDSLVSRGLTLIEVDFSPFREAARLLYEGPWLAERYLEVSGLLERDPGAIFPTTRMIFHGGARLMAHDAFAAFHRLAELQKEARRVFRTFDLLCTPTAPTLPTIHQVQADPIGINSQLGYYTNFMNLLDLCALAIPAGFRGDGMPFGVTLSAPAFDDLSLFRFAGIPFPETGTMELAVCGAHMRGLPLNGALVEARAEFLRTDFTSDEYRLVALDEWRPGLLRCAGGGAAIEVEVWKMPLAAVGDLVRTIPPPLGLGSIRLRSGAHVIGFLCEEAGASGQPDISRFGGWRAWLEHRNA